MVFCGGAPPVRTESRGMDVDYLEISGGRPLGGEINVQGSKNAVLPILAACIPGAGECVIENCPLIRDTEDTFHIMRALGYCISRTGDAVRITPADTETYTVERMEAVRIRSSVLFLGALLGKMKKAVLPLPGGCAIGKRPIDLHLRALEALGARFEIGETITAWTDGLYGTEIDLEFPSVGATENTILAAVMAKGETVIRNAAREPEVDELCAFLRQRGASVRREADGSIWVDGQKTLGPAVYRMKADRIVSGTYLLAAAAAGGQVRLINESGETLSALRAVLSQMGAVCSAGENGITVCAAQRVRPVPYLETAPYPGFPTDLQSPLLAVLAGADGESTVCETIFERRFCTAGELLKFGAKIGTRGRCAHITGVPRLHGAAADAPDLRGGAALVLAALQAEGRSVIRNTGYIARGYEDIARDLALLGADIRWADDKAE